MTMVEAFDKIKTKEDISHDFKRLVFDKFLTLMHDAGFVAKYSFDDFSMLWLTSLPYTVSFLCPFNNGLLKIVYHTLDKKFNIQLTINQKTQLSKNIFMIDDMSDSTIFISVDHELNFKSISFSYRICFENYNLHEETDEAFLDIDYTYDHVSSPLKEFNFADVHTDFDIHSLKMLPEIFYKHDLKFDHLFFDYLFYFSTKNSIFNTVFHDVPKLSNTIKIKKDIEQLFLNFWHDYSTDYCLLHDRLLILKMSTI